MHDILRLVSGLTYKLLPLAMSTEDAELPLYGSEQDIEERGPQPFGQGSKSAKAVIDELHGVDPRYRRRVPVQKVPFRNKQPVTAEHSPMAAVRVPCLQSQRPSFALHHLSSYRSNDDRNIVMTLSVLKRNRAEALQWFATSRQCPTGIQYLHRTIVAYVFKPAIINRWVVRCGNLLRPWISKDAIAVAFLPKGRLAPNMCGFRIKLTFTFNAGQMVPLFISRHRAQREGVALRNVSVWYACQSQRACYRC
jgi:hypothetical protein